MIRIDEIYYNIFLPKVQEKPLHGIHWFDPFGSVAFEDMCSLPSITWDKRAVRFLFWDQEPLHKDLLDQTLSKYATMYNGKFNLITSELNSEFVDYACNTYGFTPHYYFFHGWAALDWYRGYNRSFQITPVEQRQIKKTFIAPNRIIAGERQHRLEMLYHIFKHDLTDNHISCPNVCPVEGISIYDAVIPLKSKYPDIEEVFKNQSLPINFKGETDHPMHSCWLSLFDESAESLLYLVTETVATGQRLHLTEKTFKPIALGMPFIIVGTQGSLRYLRSYGFRTFGELWDESYDDEPDDSKRTEKISQVLELLDGLGEYRQAIFDSAQEIIKHNWNHFYNGGFEEVLWAELKTMLDKF